MSESWRDVRAVQDRRVRRGKRAVRVNNAAMAKDTPKTVPSGIHCCICLNKGGKRVQASTIVKGYAVCDDDMALVSQPTFDIFMLQTDRRPV